MRVLFYCLGNICRSPTAEAVFRKLAGEAGLDVAADSAGTGGWHAGEPPHPPMIAAAARRGYDLRPLRARQVRPADFRQFTYVFAMDRSNLADGMALRPDDGIMPELFLPLAPELGLSEMPDPYYTGTYDQTVTLAEAAARALIQRIRAGQ